MTETNIKNVAQAQNSEQQQIQQPQVQPSTISEKEILQEQPAYSSSQKKSLNETPGSNLNEIHIVDDEDLLRNVVGAHGRPYIDRYIARHNKTVQEKDNQIAELTKERDMWRANAQYYNAVTMLAEHGFDPDRYDEIFAFCRGSITPDKLVNLKKNQDYNFLLVKRGSQKKMRDENEGDDKLFSDLLKKRDSKL